MIVDDAGPAANSCCRDCGSGRRDNSQARPQLGHQELRVLLAWLRSDTKESAAEQLFITANTVKKHIERVRGKYAKVGRPATTKTALLVRAIQDGLIDLEDLL
jgi:DNA-binding CsgD family transcriptional regulator